MKLKRVEILKPDSGFVVVLREGDEQKSHAVATLEDAVDILRCFMVAPPRAEAERSGEVETP